MNISGKSICEPGTHHRIRELASLLTKEDGKPNIRAIAREVGVSRDTVTRALLTAESAVEYPRFVTEGDEHESIEEILARKRKGFERKAKAHLDRLWFELKVKESGPYGIMLWGDPHLDDDGCNLPLLERHLELAAQPGIYSVNMGDTHNNWVGRLERIYGNQETSRHTGKRLVDWFMWDSGVTWLCWIIGNHDDWNDGADFLMRLAKKKIPVIDWRAQFKVSHPSGTEVSIDASHGRKGSSIWNNLHATLRAAKLGEVADIYATAHTHNYGLEHLEIAERRHSCWLVQLRGYKWFDTHALHNGFPEHQLGSSVLAVVNPDPNARYRVQCFEDVELGADYLKWLRARA